MILSFAIASSSATAAESWPSFRGADRTGVSGDSGLLQQWPTGGPQLAWETSGAGRGYASLAIADGKIFTVGDRPAGAADDDEYLVCFDQRDGRRLWQSKTGPAWDDGRDSWQGSRGTPTIDGDSVYVLTAHGELICFSTSGAEIWRTDLKQDFAGQKADGWGYSESVLVDGERLVCTPGGERNTMVALNKLTGRAIWSCSRPDDRGAGHASVVISSAGDTRVYVQTTGSGAMGVRASDGELLWTYDIPDITAVIPTPIVRDDLVFFTAGYGLGGALLRQVASGEDGVNVEEIYPPQRDLMNKHGGVVLLDNYLYGDSEDRGILWCAELLTGKLQWKSRGSGRNSASLTAADGRLYVRYSDGTMTLVEATPDAFQEVGSFKLPGDHPRPGWAHPVVLDGHLYLREDDQILCYDVRN